MDGVLEQQAIVIGPTPPGTGVMNAGDLRGAGSTSPDEPLVGAVHADVDHRGAWLHHVGRDERRDADRGDEHVGVAGVPREVGCGSGRS